MVKVRLDQVRLGSIPARRKRQLLMNSYLLTAVPVWSEVLVNADKCNVMLGPQRMMVRLRFTDPLAGTGAQPNLLE